jgi:hypothetical protein
MGGKRKGKSAEEKKQLMLNVFTEKEEVFNLKELEKIASKQLGINSMIVKDLLQSMADDDMIHLEKVGISTYYWQFPSEAGVKLVNSAASLEATLKSLSAEKTKADCELASLQSLLCDSTEREGLIKRFKHLEEQKGKVDQQLEKFSDCDPEVYREMKAGLVTSKEAANRWIENLWNMESWMKKKFQGREDDIKKFFKQNGVTDDLDTIP